MGKEQELQELERQKKELEKKIKALKETAIDKGNVRISERFDRYFVKFRYDMGLGKTRYLTVVSHITKDELLKWTYETISNLENAIEEV